MRAVLLAAAAALLAIQSAVAGARVLTAGAGGEFKTLEQAVAAVGAGDTIHLAAGEYFECATIMPPDVVLEGEGPGTVLTDRACAGKALLIARGANLTVKDLALARARVPDMNGAGIRLEAPGLTLERVRFVNDQAGVLDGVGAPGTIRIVDCVFAGGGVAGDAPGWALRVGGVTLLHVEGSRFEGVRGGQVNSGALRTELLGNTIATGAEPGAGAAVLAAGALVMRDNVLTVGPNPPPRDAVVLATGERAELRGNRLDNRTGRALLLLLDWTASDPELERNTLAPGDRLSGSDGLLRHRTGGMARGAFADAKAAAKWVARGLLGR